MQKLLVCIVVVAAFAAPAAADKRKASIHLKQGAAYYKVEQYDAAIAEFKKAYELDKKPQTLFNIANAYYKKADYKSAIEYFQNYLSADPNGKYAQQALEFTTVANKALADEEAKAAAEAERMRVTQEQTKRRIAADGHVRQAEAFAKAGAWSSAGDEYRSAAEVSGDPARLLDAAACTGV